MVFESIWFSLIRSLDVALFISQSSGVDVGNVCKHCPNVSIYRSHVGERINNEPTVSEFMIEFLNIFIDFIQTYSR